MDRPASSATDRPAAVRAGRVAALDLLLPTTAGKRGESAPAPAPGRAVLGVSLLRQPQDGRPAEGEPQAHPAPDADSGHRSALSQAAAEPPGAGPRSLSVPTAGRHDRT